MSELVVNPRYPIGHAPAAESLNAADIPAYITTLAALPESLRAAVDGLSETQLDTPYREGGWTVRQLVHHLADSHMSAYIATRLALTEDWPRVSPYDEKLWALLPDNVLPVEVSLEVLEPLHHRWAAIFKAMQEGDWQRGYDHPQGGRSSLLWLLGDYSWHSRHHVAHITELRKSKGW